MERFTTIFNAYGSIGGKNLLDLILRNCNIIDGVSDICYAGDIGVLGDKIVKIGNLKELKATAEIDCAGRVVAPGFIDVHSHSDLNPFIENGFDSKIRQGVTTEVIGNCGYSVYPLAGEFLEKVKREAEEYGITVTWRTFREYVEEVSMRGKLPINIIAQAGLSAVRAFHSGYSARPLTHSELAAVQNDVSQMLQDGAAGVSTGMIYPPCCYFETDELVNIMGTVALHGGVFATHMRSEGDGLLEAVAETLQIVRKSGVSLQISHLKTAERHNWYKLDSAFELIESAIRDGFNITADRYPYLASQTSLDMTLPKWIFDGGDEIAIRRLSDNLVSAKIKGEVLKKHPVNSEYWESIMVSQTFAHENLKFEGFNFRQVYNFLKTAKPDCQKFDIVDCLIEFLCKERLKTSAIFFNMCEKNLEKILLKPYVMVGSDATARTTAGPLAKGRPHPRAFSAFVKFLTDFVTKKKVLTLPQAISKITHLPSVKYNIAGRGRIAPSFYADLVVLDPNCLDEANDYIKPMSYPGGINYVIVNGSVVFSNLNNFNRVYPGRMLPGGQK